MNAKKHQPLISVIMPVYNAGNFLIEAIESILDQTYQNLEFIIIDDGSTDNSWEIIKNYSEKDKRIRAFKNSKNLGVSTTANFAINKARGQFIARMDADDISFFDRLEKQVRFLAKNPDIIAVGGQCVVIDEKNKVIGDKIFPINPKKLREMIFWSIPFQQPSIMINRSLLPKNFNWYFPACTSAEEVNLLFKLMKYGKITNLKDWLLFYRYLPDSLSHKNPKKTFWLTLKSRIGAAKSGFTPTPKALALNLSQIIIIALLPSKTINNLWHFLRGISREKTKIPEFAKNKTLGELTILR